MKMEGIYKVKPSIIKISFRNRDKIKVFLEDGREIIIPLKYFPSIKKLNKKQRMHYTIMDDEMVMFKDCVFIYHIQDFLGKEQEYRYLG